jgi:alkylation response protein AidB-like acyl-CoA dehydrogenase
MHAGAGPYTPPLPEALFLLDKVVDWGALSALPTYASFDINATAAALTAGARFASEILAPTNAIGDSQPPALRDGRVRLPSAIHAAFKQYCADGWPGFDLPVAHGGQGLPLVAQVAFAEMVNGANVAFGMLPIMLRAAAWLLLEHGSPHLIEEVVPHLVSGKWGATICISEAEAGSDVGRIATVAAPQQAGTYALTGTKSWISYGDHDLTTQAVHMVLARTPDAPSGTRGLSLFLVPRLRFDNGARNDWSVTRLEHKMGLHGSPTCVLNFEGAIGYRVGSLHQGLRGMFTMINLMRLEVSIQGIGVAEAAADKAVRYAHQRRQGGAAEAPPPSIIEHPDIRRLLLGMQARIRPLRALIFEVAMNLDHARFGTDAVARSEALDFAEFMLPVCKTCAAETAFLVASDAVQIGGGVGYTNDAGIEQHLRDSRIMAIYEGTSGIQALDLVSRKLLKDQGARYQRFMARIRRDIAATPASAGLDLPIASLQALVSHLETATSTLLTVRIAAHTEGGASDYLQLLGLVASGWMWLRMLASDDTTGEPCEFRRACGDFFRTYYAPMAAILAARIADVPPIIDRARATLFTPIP